MAAKFHFSGLFCMLLGLMGTNGASAAQPTFKKVMIIVFENEDYSQVVNQPFFKKIAAAGASLSNFHAEAHPSQPNYIAMISGDTQGVHGDGAVNLNGRHIGDLLESQGRSWKVYAEGYPGGCNLTAQIGNYARKHIPFISFRNVQIDSARCQRIVNANTLDSDIQNGTLPDYSLYVPDLKNDGHDTGAAFADRWFAKAFAGRLQDPKFMNDLLFVVTHDEAGDDEPTNHIYTALYGASVVAGSVDATSYNHYSLLRTIEDTLGLGTLGAKDAKAAPIGGVWR